MSYDNKRQPQSAQDFLIHAANTLDSRGQQYDPSDKKERSMTAIVAAFNAIYPVYAQHGMPLTVHQGWQFMTLVKMVRGATKPHIDSALDQVAYASLAAEEVANQLVQPVAKELCIDEGCPHHGTPHVCITSVETSEQCKLRCAEQPEAEVDRLNAIIAKLEATVASARNSLTISEDASHTELERMRGRLLTKDSLLVALEKDKEELSTRLIALEQVNKAAIAEIDKLNHQIGVDGVDRQGLVTEIKVLRSKLAGSTRAMRSAQSKECPDCETAQAADMETCWRCGYKFKVYVHAKSQNELNESTIYPAGYPAPTLPTYDEHF